METPLITDLVSAGGAGLLIPAVLFVLVHYGARGLFGWHGRRSRNRKEFLDLWTSERIDDDLWLEVTVRHLFGRYLPAHVIRTALQHPASAQSLLDLSDLWPLLRYDADSKTVRWKNARHRHLDRRPIARYMPLIRYFLLAGLASGAGLFAYLANDNSLIRWTYSFLTLVLAGAAFVSVNQEDAIKVAAESGEKWILRINSDERPLSADSIASTKASSDP